MSTDNPQTKDSQASEHSSIIARFDPRKADAGVCLFTLGGKRFALDTALVGEVVTVSRMLRVPLSPAAVLGLFSLRGTPVAVVDLLAVFAMGGGRPSGDETQVLVLRTSEGVVAGVRIDRLDAYEWPAANLRLNAMLLQWVTANPER